MPIWHLKMTEKRYDEQFQVVFEAIRQLMAEPETQPKKIGFNVSGKKT